MIVWMRRHARDLKGDLRAQRRAARWPAARRSRAGRDGVLRRPPRGHRDRRSSCSPSFQSADRPGGAGIGARARPRWPRSCIGYAGSTAAACSINLARFFRVTGVVLVLVAAGLLASAAAHRPRGRLAHRLPGPGPRPELAGRARHVDVGAADRDARPAAAARPRPRSSSSSLYLIPLLALRAAGRAAAVRRAAPRPPRRRSRDAAACVAAGACRGRLAGCGSAAARGRRRDGSPARADGRRSSSPTPAARPATLKRRRRARRRSRSRTTARAASPSSRCSNGARILGENENLAPGSPARSRSRCSPATTRSAAPAARPPRPASLTVGGAARRRDRPTRGCRPRSPATAATSTRRPRSWSRAYQAFAAAVKAGDVEQAKRLFAAARVPYETIEPVAESFGDLDPDDRRARQRRRAGPAVDGLPPHREGAVGDGTRPRAWTPIADKLLADVKTLEAQDPRRSTYQPDELANGANELLDEVATSKITGEEDRYSHTDLSDFEANVDGAQTTFGLLAPALQGEGPGARERRSSRASTPCSSELEDAAARAAATRATTTVDGAERKRLASSSPSSRGRSRDLRRARAADRRVRLRVTLVLLGRAGAPAPRRTTRRRRCWRLGAQYRRAVVAHDAALAARLRTEARLLSTAATPALATPGADAARHARSAATVAAGRRGGHARAPAQAAPRRPARPYARCAATALERAGDEPRADARRWRPTRSRARCGSGSARAAATPRSGRRRATRRAHRARPARGVADADDRARDALSAAEQTLGEVAISRGTVVTDAAIIVFREGLEAVLILAAITASFVGARGAAAAPGAARRARGHRRDGGHVGARAAARLRARHRRAAAGGDHRRCSRSRCCSWSPTGSSTASTGASGSRASTAGASGSRGSASSPARRSGSASWASPASTARASRPCSSCRTWRSARAAGACLLGAAIGLAATLAVGARHVRRAAQAPLQEDADRHRRADRGRARGDGRHHGPRDAGPRLAAELADRRSPCPLWANRWLGIYATWEGIASQLGALVLRGRLLRRGARAAEPAPPLAPPRRRAPVATRRPARGPSMVPPPGVARTV